jgi:membrane associated rhomboid family serine protease
MRPLSSETLFERKRLVYSAFVPAILVVILWLVKVIEVSMDFDFSFLGVFPREIKGLPGIVLCPFIHGDFWHLFSNSVPFFFLLSGIFYFFPRVAFRVLLLIWLLTGFYVWLGGRTAFHIGASGLVYGFAAFLFTSGIIARDNRMLALTLVITFLYGNMIWGVFPIWKKVSWESHLLGMFTGVVLAFVYRDSGPKKQVYEWELDEDEPDEGNERAEYQPSDADPRQLKSNIGNETTVINYHWTPGTDGNKLRDDKSKAD